MKYRIAVGAAVAAACLVGPGVAAAHAIDLGGEHITISIDNNHLTNSLCIVLDIRERNKPPIIHETICLPAL